MRPSPPKKARILDILFLLMSCLVHAFGAIIRRIVRGPMRPSWGWKFETIVGLQKATYKLIPKFGVARYYHAVQAILPPLDSAGTKVEEINHSTFQGHWMIPSTESDAVILYFHGGGYVYGSLQTHGNMVGTLASCASAKTLMLDYRLAPAHPHPAATEDACAAYRYLVESGILPENIIFAGDSSGGGLVLTTLIALRDAGDPLPAAGVAISPWVNLQCSDDSFESNSPFDPVTRAACLTCADAYLNGLPSDDPTVSPLHADLTGLPPLLIHAGEVEVLVDQIKDFAARVSDAGVDVQLTIGEDMIHVWHMLLMFTPEAQKSIDEIACFVKTHTK